MADVWTLSLLLIVLWLMGLVTGYTLGGLVHVLGVLGVVVAIRSARRRRPVGGP
jgi:hypothetical protein